MKRSEINAAIRHASLLCEKNGVALPEFSRWNAAAWKAEKEKIPMMRKAMLGWDVTDFGSGDFGHVGAVLFTARNGTLRGEGTPYAEKYIIFKEGQFLPLHFHYKKTEDIINRGVGIMTVELYRSGGDESVIKTGDVDIYCDGRLVTVKAGEAFAIGPGNSITLIPGIYHRFGAKSGDGDLISGEVSSINDDNIDNRFAGQMGRFAKIEEDEEILYPLCNETEKII
ncbi:MAG: D-lyxose/D-mannose family sugar isomerase [Treponema sp.]|nr:D-lyxose/D-mannose family sugar isomerase [Treponema sp.]